ncbi:hypothetical protein QFC19_008036 [Naganishia cerealis]|uniref:Uncharacterized protein n=1 Tax=Naganishia cerealis TaxID=610337 RepID=A0ACC2V5J5_9TREE|nr:hypothetical protein QFC19_008036 [Naganishia cerealis]
MADEYDALEAAASSFAASTDQIGKISSDPYSSRNRERSPGRHSSSRGDRGDRGDRDRRDRDGNRDRDRDHRSSRGGDRDRDAYRGDRRDRYEGGNDDNGNYRSGSRRQRDDQEYPPRDMRDRRRHDDDMSGGYGGRRRSPPVARSMRDDREYDSPRRNGGGRHGYEGGGGGRRDRGDGGRRGGNEFFMDRPRSPTPVDAVPLSERIRAPTRWDERPAGFEGMNAMQAKMTGQFPAPGPNRQPIPAMFGNPGFPGALDARGDPIMSSFAGPMGGVGNPMRQSKRLYVGNVQLTCNEQNLADFFNHKMSEQGFASNLPGDPVVAVQLNHEKSYAFIEYRTPEEATAAMAFDGIIFQGTPLKIRRPKDYVGPEGAAGSIHIPGVVSTTVQDSPNKIYIGGLPTYLGDEQVMELLKSFGELKSFNLVKEGAGQTGASKGFAFCEYVDTAVTDMAIAGLNGFNLADRVLTVQRASQGKASNTAISTGSNMTPTGVPSLRSVAPNILASAASAAAQAPTTRCMLMLNMVTPEELYDDQEYQEILEDINEECSKYGEVEGVRVPRPVKRETKWAPGETAAQSKQAAAQADEEAGVGKVFVLFKDLDGVSRALQNIAGRSFGGRTILCANVSEDEFLGPAPPPPPPPEFEDDAAAVIADISG